MPRIILTRTVRMAARTAHDRPRWQLPLLSVLVSLGVLVSLDLALRACGWVPAEDPLVLHTRSGERAFTPFVRDAQGKLTIRPDWVHEGDGLRGVRGREGRTFLFPGFRPARFDAAPPEGTLRVFALGGSTTFGLYVGADDAFPERLERKLERAAPDREVEVINLGCAGWASDRVVNLLPGLVELEPDLWIVYSGHNELLARGAGTERTGLARLRATLLGASTLLAWLDRGLTALWRPGEMREIREAEAALEAGGALAFDPWNLPPERRRPPDAALLQQAADAYARNLRRMVESADAAGVPLVFALPVSNLLYPPVFGAERADTPRFEAAMEAGAAALAEGRPRLAVAHFQEALSLAPRHARAQHQLGMALLASGDLERARKALERARDLDVRTHRMTRPLEAALVRVAEETGTPWVDLRPVFADALDAATSRRLFVDHLHPTAAGHERIADALLPAAARALGLAPATAAPGAAARPGAG